MKPTILFIQNSANLAGAQKCLFRLLVSPALAERFSVEMLIGETGWLTRACDAAGVRYHLRPFPSSRSLGGKLWGNRQFVARAKALFKNHHRVIVHANDHPDSLLGLGLARALRAPSVLTLRTPGMSGRDFEKYRCGNYDALISVGEQLFEAVGKWHTGSPHTLVHDGISAEELLPPPPPTAGLEEVAVIGSLAARKGWRDLVDALVLLEAGGRTVLPRFVFIGDTKGADPERVLGTDRLRHAAVEFAGSVEDFATRVRKFPLAVHPSRDESFGMAAIETVAAGVPLLAGATGLIPAFVPNPAFLFEPGDVHNLAGKLTALLRSTPASLQEAFAFPAAQEVIAKDYTLDLTVDRMLEIYGRLLPR